MSDAIVPNPRNAAAPAGLRDLIRAGGFVAAPGVYDGFSAMLAQRYDFEAVYMSGYSVAASRYGLPDAGLVGMAQMLDAVRVIRRVCDKPLIADADTGYGGLLNVQHTVREYEAAGASAVQLEDQEMPKKCGHTKGKRVVDAEEMAAKIEVAAEARRSDGFLIVARTDSRAGLGLDEALRRGRLYREAGADVVFVEAPQSLEEMERVGAELEGPLLINMVPRNFLTPETPVDRLKEMGFGVAIYPGLMAFPAVGAMQSALERFLVEGEVDPKAGPTISPHDLVGFPAVWADEERWQLRYGDDKVPPSRHERARGVR